MSDILAQSSRVNGADLEFYDKATGTTTLALRAGQIVDLSTAVSVLMPAPNSQTVTVTLTAAQVNALHGTPITLLAAQGAGTLIDVSNILYEFKYGSAQFATSTGVINLFWGSGGIAIGTTGIATALLKGTTSLVIGDLPVVTAAAGIATSILNTALVVQNPSATEYTVGTGCSLIVRATYRVISGL